MGQLRRGWDLRQTT